MQNGLWYLLQIFTNKTTKKMMTTHEILINKLILIPRGHIISNYFTSRAIL